MLRNVVKRVKQEHLCISQRLMCMCVSLVCIAASSTFSVTSMDALWEKHPRRLSEAGLRRSSGNQHGISYQHYCSTTIRDVPMPITQFIYLTIRAQTNTSHLTIVVELILVPYFKFHLDTTHAPQNAPITALQCFNMLILCACRGVCADTCIYDG